jgi:hypothetical protein
MKFIFTLAVLTASFSAFSQWTRVEQLPSSDISSLYQKDNIFYAGGKNIIYISRNNGLSWDSTNPIPQLFLVTSIIVYKNELYATAPHRNVFKSHDSGKTWQGTTWQSLTPGTFPDVADFCEFRGELYAATFGNSVFKLDTSNPSRWLSFSNGLSSLSANLPVIAANSNAVIAGTLANGIYGQLPANSTSWEERLLTGALDPNEGAYGIVTAHDTLFYAGTTGKFYMSTDNGLNWGFIGDRLPSAATRMVNTKQAVILSRHIFAGTLQTQFFYLKKSSLQASFVNFSTVGDAHFTYDLEVSGNKLWDASNKGLFSMSLSDLPGITAANDTGTPIVLPLRFLSLNVTCRDSQQILNWKTAQEQSNSFTIERSTDRLNWISIGTQGSPGGTGMDHSYQFTDAHSIENSYYRIAQTGFEGRTQYSDIVRSSCISPGTLSSWPNPFADILTVNLETNKASQVLIDIIDSKGAVVKSKKVTTVQGNNQLTLDVKSLTAGFYQLRVVLNNGQLQKTLKVFKL